MSIKAELLFVFNAITIVLLSMVIIEYKDYKEIIADKEVTIKRLNLQNYELVRDLNATKTELENQKSNNVEIMSNYRENYSIVNNKE